MDYNTFANNIKAKYPQYKDEDNLELAKKVVDKYPIYKKQVDIPEQSLMSKIGSTINESGNKSEAIIKDNNRGVISRGVGATAEGFKGAMGVIGNVLGSIPGVDKLKPVGEAIGTGVGAIVKPIVENKYVQQYSKDLAKSLGGEENLQTLADAGDIANTILGAEFGGKGLVKTGAIAKDVSGKALETGSKVINAGGEALKTGVDIAKTTGSAIKMAGEGLTSIPSRVATNVAEKKAVEQTIKQLPKKTAQQAVREGVDIADVKFFTDLPKTQKHVIKKLATAVRDFESGASKVDPIEAVGKPLIDRLATVRKAQGEVGQKLGDTANKLGNIAEDEAFIPVYDSLRKVRGLEGLRLGDDGLDFTDTVLASVETASDRKAIQSIFDQAVKAGTGKQKHLLRQELREVLGGKKAGGVQLTGTQENAFEAIRKGLSNLLDSVNPDYKKLNAEYAKLSEPLSKLTKVLRIGNETDADILNLKAGLLARRLTSNAVSNPEIKSLLNQIDKVTTKKGVTKMSIENLQDAINIFGKYYDIAPKTGFKNQVAEGVSGGVKDFVVGTVRDIAGSTNATRKKALENALKDLLE
jgi:hypothetical protein